MNRISVHQSARHRTRDLLDAAAGSAAAGTARGQSHRVAARDGQLVALDGQRLVRALAVHAVGHRERAGGVVGIVDSIGVHISARARLRDGDNALAGRTFRTCRTRRTDRTLRTRGARRTLNTLETLRTLLTLGTLLALKTLDTLNTLRTHRTLLPVVHHEGVGTVRVGDRHHRAVTYRHGRHCGGVAVQTVRAILTVLAVLAILAILAISACRTGWARRSGRTLLTVQYREGVGAGRIRDGYLCAVVDRHRRHRGRNTILAVLAIGAVGSVGAIGTVKYSEAVRTVRVRDRHHCAVAVGGLGGGHRRGEARRALKTLDTLLARGTGRTLLALGAVVNHEVRRLAVSEMDRVGVVQSARRRTRDALDAHTVLAVGTVGAVGAVQDCECMGTVKVSDGYLRARGRGIGGHDGREAVLAVRAVGTVLAGRSLDTLRTSRTGGTGRTGRTLLPVAQHVGLHRPVGQCHHQHVARVGRRHRDGGHVARVGRVQCVRNAQQLLHALDAVVDAALRVYLRLQVERAHSPGNLAEVLARVAGAHLNREEAVHVRRHRVRLRIDRRTRGAALQNGQTDGDVLLRHQGIVAVAHHRLIAHLLRRLRKQGNR